MAEAACFAAFDSKRCGAMTLFLVMCYVVMRHQQMLAT